MLRYLPIYFSALFLVAGSPLTRAELPPSAYDQMQKAAPEVLRIKVLRVDVTEVPAGKDVSALVQVLKVGRTQSDLKVDDLVTIRYEIPARPAGWVGPGAVPLLADDEERIAYLKKLGDSPDYAPAAGAMTFDRFH